MFVKEIPGRKENVIKILDRRFLQNGMILLQNTSTQQLQSHPFACSHSFFKSLKKSFKCSFTISIAQDISVPLLRF